MEQKIIEFPQPREARGTVTVEVFRRGRIAVHIEMPRRTLADVTEAASLSHEPVERIMCRYVQRLGEGQNPAIIPRRGPCRYT